MIAVLQLAVAALLGLVVIPTVVGGSASAIVVGGGSPRTEAVIWLGLAVLLTVWVLAVVPSATRAVGDLLARLPWRGPSAADGIHASEVRVLSLLLIGVVAAALVEALVRRPLVLVLAAVASPLPTDAIVAATGAFLVLLLLIRLYHVAIPFVEGSAWLVLDVLVPTTGSETAARFASSFDQPTRVAPTLAVEATRLAATLAETVPMTDLGSTVAAQPVGPNAGEPPGDVTVAQLSSQPATIHSRDLPTVPGEDETRRIAE
jgi:hypothetical protein